MATATPRRVVIHHPRGIRSRPVAVVARQRPEIPAPGPAPTRIQNRCPRLVHEQLTRAQQQFTEPIHQRRQVKRRLAHPASQRGTIQIHALASVYL